VDCGEITNRIKDIRQQETDLFGDLEVSSGEKIDEGRGSLENYLTETLRLIDPDLVENILPPKDIEIREALAKKFDFSFVSELYHVQDKIIAWGKIQDGVKIIGYKLIDCTMPEEAKVLPEIFERVSNFAKNSAFIKEPLSSGGGFAIINKYGIKISERYFDNQYVVPLQLQQPMELIGEYNGDPVPIVESGGHFSGRYLKNDGSRFEATTTGKAADGYKFWHGMAVFKNGREVEGISSDGSELFHMIEDFDLILGGGDGYVLASKTIQGKGLKMFKKYSEIYAINRQGQTKKLAVVDEIDKMQYIAFDEGPNDGYYSWHLDGIPIYFNLQGETIIPKAHLFEDEKYYEFSEGYAIVSGKPKDKAVWNYYYFDQKTGLPVGYPDTETYKSATDFDGGWAIIQDLNGAYWVVDSSFKIRRKIPFADIIMAGKFFEGRAYISTTKGMFFIDKYGRRRTPVFDKITNPVRVYQKGIARVVEMQEEKYFDLNGKRLFERASNEL